MLKEFELKKKKSPFRPFFCHIPWGLWESEPIACKGNFNRTSIKYVLQHSLLAAQMNKTRVSKGCMLSKKLLAAQGSAFLIVFLFRSACRLARSLYWQLFNCLFPFSFSFSLIRSILHCLLSLSLSPPTPPPAEPSALRQALSPWQQGRPRCLLLARCPNREAAWGRRSSVECRLTGVLISC